MLKILGTIIALSGLAVSTVSANQYAFYLLGAGNGIGVKYEQKVGPDSTFGGLFTTVDQPSLYADNIQGYAADAFWSTYDEEIFVGYYNRAGIRFRRLGDTSLTPYLLVGYNFKIAKQFLLGAGIGIGYQINVIRKKSSTRSVPDNGLTPIVDINFGFMF